jgi:hypothetical protein
MLRGLGIRLPTYILFAQLLVLISCATGITPSHSVVSGQWIERDSKKVYYVQLESVGNNTDQAIQSALKQAVTYAVGALVVSEIEVKNSQVARQEIIQYSSGFIDDYKVIKSSQDGNQTKLLLDVWVAESKIANRLLNESKSSGEIDGSRAATQLKSLVQEMQSSDQLLEGIVRDFPKRAFDIKLGKTTINRVGGGAQIQIPVSIAWNNGYIDGLIEALEKTRDGRYANSYQNHPWGSIIQYRGRSSWGQSIAAYHDANKFEILKNSFILSNPMIRLHIKGELRSISFDQCYRYGHFSSYWGERTAFGYMPDRYGNTAGQFYYTDGDSPGNNSYSAVFHILGDFKDDFTLTINLESESDINALASMKTIEVSVVPARSCSLVNP